MMMFSLIVPIVSQDVLPTGPTDEAECESEHIMSKPEQSARLRICYIRYDRR